MLASVKIFTSRSALDARIRDRDLGRNQPELEDIVMDASTRIGGSKIPHMVWKEVAHLERRSRGMERMWLFHEDIELLQSLREQVERVCRGDSRKCMPIDISVRSAKAVGAAAPAADPSLPCTSGVVSPLLWNFTGFGKENLVPKLGSFLLHPVLGKMPTS